MGGVGRDGRVIDLHVPTGREGGRRRGRERRRWGERIYARGGKEIRKGRGAGWYCGTTKAVCVQF